MNTDLPTREELKKMVTQDRWDEIGRIFDFTPKFHVGMTKFLDWRCLPDSVLLILGSKPAPTPKLKANGQPRKLGAYPRLQFPPSDRIGIPHKKVRFGGFFDASYKSQKGICCYCERFTLVAEWSVDHKLPIARDGRHGHENLIGCCKNCNGIKGFLTYEEFMSLNPKSDNIHRQSTKLMNRIRPPLTRHFTPRINNTIQAIK